MPLTVQRRVHFAQARAGGGEGAHARDELRVLARAWLPAGLLLASLRGVSLLLVIFLSFFLLASHGGVRPPFMKKQSKNIDFFVCS